MGRSDEAKTQDEEEWEEKGVRERGCVPRDTFLRGPREGWPWGGREGGREGGYVERRVNVSTGGCEEGREGRQIGSTYRCQGQGEGDEVAVAQPHEEVVVSAFKGGEEDGAGL